MIRPYQSCIFPNRISNIYFNKDGDPHKKNGRNIPGTAEKVGQDYNSTHYLTRTGDKAQTNIIPSVLAIFSIL